MVNSDKWDKLAEWMEKLHINEDSLIEKFIIGSGKGGQKLHKTASTVYLKHIPSGIEIKCQESRSREGNRYFARVRLCEKYHAIISDEKTKITAKSRKTKTPKKAPLRAL